MSYFPDYWAQTCLHLHQIRVGCAAWNCPSFTNLDCICIAAVFLLSARAKQKKIRLELQGQLNPTPTSETERVWVADRRRFNLSQRSTEQMNTRGFEILWRGRLKGRLGGIYFLVLSASFTVHCRSTSGIHNVSHDDVCFLAMLIEENMTHFGRVIKIQNPSQKQYVEICFY